MSQILCYNIYIQIDEGDVHLSRFSQEYHLSNNSYFQWLQLINSIPEKWKLTIKQSKSDVKNLIIHGHHLIKGSRILILEKLTSKDLYQILISSLTNKVTSVTYSETKFNGNSLDWTKIFILPRLTTYNPYLRSFQYKILHNILFLDKMLYLSEITKSPLCSYCNTNDETPIHLFCECNSTKSLWLQLNRHLHSDLEFPELTPQTVILGIFNDSVSNILLINHILFIFKLYIYKSRSKHWLNINELLANIRHIKKLENVAAVVNVKAVAAYNKKWDITNRKLPL